MTMEIDVSKYLTEQQMAEIAQRIFTEKVTSNIDDMINKKERYGRGVFNEVYKAIVEKYANQINDKYKEKIEKAIQAEIERTESYDPDYNDTFYETINSTLHDYAKKVIDERSEELKPIVYDKILVACNNDLFGKIVSDIIYRLDINGTIKEVAEKINLKEMTN